MTQKTRLRPVFFCVGAAKSGTTALHFYLRQHPEIFMPLKKEIHHFAPDLLKPDDVWLNRERYLSLFKKAKPGQVIGETSVLHLLSEEAANQIKAFEPNAKIIILLRNPLEVIHARHAQLVFNGEENITDFEETLKIENERKMGRLLPPNTRIQKKHLPVYAVSFAGQVERFLKAFDRKQIYILWFEDFKGNPVAEVRKLYKFLGVDDSFAPELKIVNARKKIRSRRAQRFFKLLSSKFLERIMDENAIEAIRLKFDDFNSKIIEVKSIKPETKAMLLQELQPEIEKLSRLLNKDLIHWTNE